MKKKGVELALNTIIITILVLIVLVILVIVFKSQIADLFETFTNLIKSAGESASSIDIGSIIKNE